MVIVCPSKSVNWSLIGNTCTSAEATYVPTYKLIGLTIEFHEILYIHNTCMHVAFQFTAHWITMVNQHNVHAQ